MLTKKLIFAAMFILLAAAGAVQAGGDPAKGQELSVDCADCHGEDGKGDEDNPPIAGLDETEHLNMLKAYKSGELVDEEEVMLMFTEDLSEQDMADLAAYYATLAN
jgi:sulfide dehydrogenase cytochrome subunit